MKKILVISAFIVLWGAVLSAQPVTIKGKVSDKTGVGLPGASIVVKGTTTGTVTDANGMYSLSVPSVARTLVFSFVGMTSKELPMGEKRNLT